LKQIYLKLLCALLLLPVSYLVPRFHDTAAAPKPKPPTVEVGTTPPVVSVQDIKPIEIPPETVVQPLQAVEPVPVPETTAPPVPTKLEALLAAGWHFDCRSQTAAVEAEVNAMGLGADWFYIDYILGRESCHDPGRLNSNLCGGLGQACPIEKLGCGANDIHCQLVWFNNYAQAKGGWAASYALWLSQNWW